MLQEALASYGLALPAASHAPADSASAAPVPASRAGPEKSHGLAGPNRPGWMVSGSAPGSENVAPMRVSRLEGAREELSVQLRLHQLSLD